MTAPITPAGEAVALLLCPFCGGEGECKVAYCADHFGNHAVRCACGARTGNGPAEECAAAWNTRASPAPDLAGMRERVADAILDVLSKAEVEEDVSLIAADAILALFPSNMKGTGHE